MTSVSRTAGLARPARRLIQTSSVLRQPRSRHGERVLHNASEQPSPEGKNNSVFANLIPVLLGAGVGIGMAEHELGRSSAHPQSPPNAKSAVIPEPKQASDPFAKVFGSVSPGAANYVSHVRKARQSAQTPMQSLPPQFDPELIPIGKTGLFLRRPPEMMVTEEVRHHRNLTRDPEMRTPKVSHFRNKK